MNVRQATGSAMLAGLIAGLSACDTQASVQNDSKAPVYIGIAKKGHLGIPTAHRIAPGELASAPGCWDTIDRVWIGAARERLTPLEITGPLCEPSRCTCTVNVSALIAVNSRSAPPRPADSSPI